MYLQKKQMSEAAVFYYEKKLTQGEIAKKMNLSRQTVSKLLSDAVAENIVEIKINCPKVNCTKLEQAICGEFEIKNAVVCGVSNENEELCTAMTVKKAAEYVLSVANGGNKNIAVSWGRTVEMLIAELNGNCAGGNVVFPLFGATDIEQSFFSSNELAKAFADKIGARARCAWFPYRTDSAEDGELLKKTSYYKSIYDLWNNIDIAVVGIGNTDIIRSFGKIFGYNKNYMSAVGDISTHFFDIDGNFMDLYENTLCASKENLKNARETIAVACGKEKTEAAVGALRTGVIDTFVTDEYTAERILTFSAKEKK